MNILAHLRLALRDADWLDAGRARGYANLFFGVSLVAIIAWIALSHHGFDVAGKPLGTDFVSFWTASNLALEGAPTDAYNVAAHWREQTALFGRDIGYTAFFYPPTFLLLCLPLAIAPYFVALALWLATTLAAYVVVIWEIGERRIGYVAILAFPAVLMTLGHGQNALLTTALFGGGVLLLDRRPALAGALLGALIIKPHLGLLIPFALIAARRWRSLFGAIGSALGLCAMATLAFGAEIWRAFLAASPLAGEALSRDLIGDEKMVSIFAALRLLGAPTGAAYGVQALAALMLAASFFWLSQRAQRSAAQGPYLVAATLLASPFLLDYDLTLLAVPLAWLTAQGLARGFLPYEKTALALAFVLPVLARSVAGFAGLPLAPLVVGLLAAVLLRRAQVEAPQESLDLAPLTGFAQSC